MDVDRVAAVPYRYRKGKVEVLLITSKGTGRWILPKGHIEERLGAKGSALLEAFEEAGVEGEVHVVPVGRYGHRDAEDMQIQAYLLRVTRVFKQWPERAHRRRRWVEIRKALSLVDADVREILYVATELLI